MPELQKQKIMCPKCGRIIEFETWDSIEIPYDGEQKEKVMDNTFFRVLCDGCRMLFPVAYPCIYNDLEQRYLIWMAPKMDEKEQQDIVVYNQRLKSDNALRLAQNGYTFRIVRNGNELREKILIFDEGLDDRFIETMKIAYVPSIRKIIGKDSKIMGLYFDKRPDGEYQWVVMSNDRKPLSGKIDMSVYEDMKVKLADIAEEKMQEGLVQVNAKWASEVMAEYEENRKEK